MNMTITMLRTVAEVLVQRLRDAREDERGMTTETIIITALLAALAIIVVGLIGERGREVKEFIEDILGEDGIRRSVVVAAR